MFRIINIVILFYSSFIFSEDLSVQFNQILQGQNYDTKAVRIFEFIEKNKSRLEPDFFENKSFKKDKYYYYGKGIFLKRLKKINDAYEALYTGYDLCKLKNIGDHEYIFYTFCQLLYEIERNNDNHSVALFYLNEIYQLYLSSKNYNYYYCYLVEMGVYNRDFNNFEKSYVNFNNALKIENLIDNKSDFDWVNCHIGRNFLMQNKIEIAKKHYQLVEKELINKGKPLKLYVRYEYLLIEIQQKRKKEAINIAHEIINYKDSVKYDRYIIGPTMSKLGQLYFDQNKDSALFFLNESLQKSIDLYTSENVDETINYLLKFDKLPLKSSQNIAKYLNRKLTFRSKFKFDHLVDLHNLYTIEIFDRELALKKDLATFFLIFSIILSIVFFYHFKKREKLLEQINVQKDNLKQANKNLQIANNGLLYSLKENEFTNKTLAHDIKSSILSIKLLSQDQDNLLNLNLINKEAKQLQNTVTNILDSNIALKIKSSKTKIDLNKIINESIDSLHNLMIYINPQININIDQSAKIFEGFRANFYQLFKNLIENSLKYSNPKRNCTIDINAYLIENNLVIKFRDNGMGISKSKINKIERNFKQFVNKKTNQGYGLGMLICYRIVKLYDGTLKIESKVNEFTEICVEMYI